MENVVMVTFDVESQAYQAFSQLKNDSVNSAYTILQMAVLKNENGRVVAVDGFDSETDAATNTLVGGLLGSVLGILGGPLGVLLCGGVGLIAGSIVDASDADDESTLLEYVSQTLGAGQTAIIALVQETDEAAFNLRLQDYDCVIMRWDAAEVADEVEQERQVQKQLAKQAKEELRAQKKADRKQEIEEKRQAIRQKFDDFKQRL